jgi:hypothetical protein
MIRSSLLVMTNLMTNLDPIWRRFRVGGIADLESDSSTHCHDEICPLDGICSASRFEWTQ